MIIYTVLDLVISQNLLVKGHKALLPIPKNCRRVFLEHAFHGWWQFSATIAAADSVYDPLSTNLHVIAILGI